MSRADEPWCILLVEDHPLNRKLLKRLLELSGHTVHGAADAHEALAVLASIRPDIILTDIQMPGMSGLELTQRLRADERYATLPIIAISAYASGADRQRALSVGCDGFLSKPIRTRTILSEIADIVRATEARL